MKKIFQGDKPRLWKETFSDAKCPKCGRHSLAGTILYRVWHPFGKKGKARRGQEKRRVEVCMRTGLCNYANIRYS